MNKVTSTYRNFWQLSASVFLAVLLIMSPCSVRNGIEQSLGFKITTVANKSKSAEIKAHTCLSADIQQNISWSKTGFAGLDAVPAGKILIPLSQLAISPKHFSLTSYMGDAVKIPFYILYSSFRFHL